MPARLGDPIEEAYKNLIAAIDARIIERIKKNIKLHNAIHNPEGEAAKLGLDEPWK